MPQPPKRFCFACDSKHFRIPNGVQCKGKWMQHKNTWKVAPQHADPHKPKCGTCVTSHPDLPNAWKCLGRSNSSGDGFILSLANLEIDSDSKDALRSIDTLKTNIDTTQAQT